MSPQAEQIWNWAEDQFDEPDSWCEAYGPGSKRGPQYNNGGKVPFEVYEELKEKTNLFYTYGGLSYWVKVLDVQRKGDGRSAQGNIQLVRGRRLFVNLHIPVNINPPPKVVKSEDGEGDWTVPQRQIRVRGKGK
jgi:hypothetical protein